MAKLVLDQATMECMQLFSKIAKVTPKDCIMDAEQAVFVVPGADLGRAIGPKGSVIKKLEQKFGRRVKIVGWAEDLSGFIVNLCAPAKVASVDENDGVVVVTTQDHTSRGLIIGRGAATLRKYEKITQRYFDIKEIKVKSMEGGA